MLELVLIGWAVGVVASVSLSLILMQRAMLCEKAGYAYFNDFLRWEDVIVTALICVFPIINFIWPLGILWFLMQSFLRRRVFHYHDALEFNDA